MKPRVTPDVQSDAIRENWHQLSTFCLVRRWMIAATHEYVTRKGTLLMNFNHLPPESQMTCAETCAATRTGVDAELGTFSIFSPVALGLATSAKPRE